MTAHAIPYVVFGAWAALCLFMVWRRTRRGLGPGVNYVPKAMRPTINAIYRNRGWQEPFDEEGNRNQGY